MNKIRRHSTLLFIRVRRASEITVVKPRNALQSLLIDLTRPLKCEVNGCGQTHPPGYKLSCGTAE